jgi:hypothetical protein
LSQLGGLVGLACIGLGLIAIGVAWNGAAGKDYAQGQIPYLISGGGIGIGLIILGAALIVVENNRRDRMHIETQLRELNHAVGRLANALGSGAIGGGNGSPSGPGGGPLVALGSTSYHRADCRLAEGKDLALAPVSVAQAEGLNPCRICRPDELEAASSSTR